MFPLTAYLSETKALIRITIPLLLAGMMEAPLGYVANLFLAHLGTQYLAAGAIVIWLNFTLMVVMFGILTTVSMLVARYYGANDPKAIGRVVRDGFWLAIIFSVPAILLIWFAPYYLVWFGQKAEIIALAKPYLHSLVWGIVPNFTAIILEQMIIGLGQTRISILLALVWVPVNLFLDYALIFGKFGFPNLGISGLGWGTSLSMWLLLFTVITFVYLLKRNHIYIREAWHSTLPSMIPEIIRIGFPTGMMYTFEIAFFLTLTLALGRMSSEVLAANQIAMQYTGLLSTAIFFIAQGLTVRLGHLIGAGKTQSLYLSAFCGINLNLLFAFIAGFFYWFAPKLFIAADLDLNAPQNQVIIQYAVKFFAMAAFFQLLEAVRFSLFGALRALSDTLFGLITSVGMFWLIAFPLGYMFTHQLNFGPVGFWLGMVLSVLFGISMLGGRFYYLVKSNRVLKLVPK